MFRGQIVFWWSENAKLYTPIGNELYKSSTNEILGYGTREIADWLSCDLQYSIAVIDSWICKLTDIIEKKDSEDCFGMGNAHWVMTAKDKVFIGCEYIEEQQVLLNIDQLILILKKYKLFVEGDYTSSESLFEPINIEYIAERTKAIRIFESLDGSCGMPY